MEHNETMKNAIEAAQYGARVNASTAERAALSAKKYAEAEQPWTANQNLDEAEKFQAIAEVYATVAGDAGTTMMVRGTRKLVEAAKQATAEAKARAIEKAKTDALQDLLREITK